MRKIGVVKILAALALAFLLATPAGLAAAPTYTIDFSDVDIRKVIQTVSEITGKNFLIDDRVQGRVTVIGPKALTAEEVYQVFLAILQVKGFAMVPAGTINKVVPAANIAGYGVEMKVGRAEEESDLDRYVTQIIPVAYSSAEDIKNLLAPLLPKTDSITSYPPTNLLIVTTTESLMSRLNKIIAVVDVPGAREDIRIIPVQNAPVTDLASKVTQVLESQQVKAAPAAGRAARAQQPGQPAQAAQPADVKIIADERTNCIIAIGDQQTLERIEELVRKLDIAVPQGAGKVQVYYLQYADATELSKVLSGIPVEKSVATASEGIPPQAPPTAAPRTAAAKSDISIIADVATNALVITATPEEYAALKAVIDRLDIPREQVLVEVLIAEVSFTKTMQLGVEWRMADEMSDPNALVFGGTSFGELDKASLAFPAMPTGLVIGAIGQEISFNGVEFPNLGALIRALKTDSDVNILSTPTIVTTDNREAEIVVGQTVPFQTSQKFDANNQPIYTFDYRDVGLTLRLTPQINKDGFVKLDIFSQLEALVTNALGTQELAPTTLKRKANTSVVVQDGHTVVLGGMIRDDKVTNTSRVPFLGSLPVIGPLFRSTNTRSEKTNLIIFMTPRIMNSSEDLRKAARDRAGSIGNLPQDALDSLKGNKGTGHEAPQAPAAPEADPKQDEGTREEAPAAPEPVP